MFTLPYNPVAVVPWIVGGLLSGLIFKSSARSPISGKGAGLAGHGTMVMLPLASSGAGNSAFEGRQGLDTEWWPLKWRGSRITSYETL